MNYKFLIVVYFIFFMFICVTFGYKFNNYINQDTHTNYYFDLDKYNISDSAKGVYYHKDFFCVITKNRENKDIIATSVHELAHLLIESDQKHFLDRYNNE
jgi:Zn-dependent peptidase ImmA (M78 family)